MRNLVLQWPWALLLMAWLLPLARLLAVVRRKRTAVLERLGGEACTHRVARDRQRIAALAIMIVALARPGVNPRYLPVSGAGRDIVFVLDVSQSMLAQDAAPSRLEAAKQGVRDALETLQAERVGLVVYAGSASILCPLTRDDGFVRYMLDRATPRTVDFGGSQLISAVEKTTGEVFAEDREGYQDLVLLTDGEDHGSHHKRVAGMLDEAAAGLLIIGLGSPDEGARIPQIQEDGSARWLRHKGAVVTTRLNSEGLKALAATCGDAMYVHAGTAPFDLGRIYGEYAIGRPAGAVARGDSIVVYGEAAFALLPFALLLIALAEFDVKRWWQRIAAPALAALALVLPGSLHAAGRAPDSRHLESGFDAAVELQKSGLYEEAVEAYAGLAAGLDTMPASRAVVAFNRGLCHLALAESKAPVSARDALLEARKAQHCFLQSKRSNPAFLRAGRRLDALAERIRGYEEQVAKEEAEAPSQAQPEQEGEGEPSAMDDEDWEMTEEGEYDESMPSQGDFARSSEMQPLPAPNYSVEEILGEEAESQQFRQQTRARASAGKVEKDW